MNTTSTSTNNIDNISSTNASKSNKTNPDSDTIKNNAPQKEAFLLSKLPQFVDGIYSSDPSRQLKCTQQIRKMLGLTSKPPIKEVIDSGALPRLLQFAKENKHNALLYESIWVLINIASGLNDTSALIQASAHTILINLLKHPLYEIKLQSIWALGNIAGSNSSIRDLLLTHQILPNVLLISQLTFTQKFVTNFTDNSNINNSPCLIFMCLLATTSWVLSNLCRSAELRNIEDVLLIVQCFQHLWRRALSYQTHRDINVQEQVNEIISHISWAFSYLTDHPSYQEQLINQINNLGFIEQFVDFMDHKNGAVRHAILRLAGNIVVSSDELTEKFLNLGIFEKYCNALNLINITSREKREICWAVSNLTAGSIRHNLLFLSSNIHPILIDYLENECYEIGKESLWAISNATSERDIAVVEPLVRQGAIRALCGFLRKMTKRNLSKKNGASKMVLVALECMDNIIQAASLVVQILYLEYFKDFGAVEYLKQMQCDDSSDRVYAKCAVVMAEHYEKQLLDFAAIKLKCSSSKSQIRALEVICREYNGDATPLFTKWVNDINLIQTIFGPSKNALFLFDLLVKGYVREYNKGSYLPSDVLKLIVLWYNDCQQPHLIERCGSVLRYMLSNNLLTDNHMECIWNAIETCAGKEDNTEKKAVYSVIESVKYHFSHEQKKFMLSKLEKLKHGSKGFTEYHSKLKSLFQAEDSFDTDNFGFGTFGDFSQIGSRGSNSIFQFGVNPTNNDNFSGFQF